VEKILKIAQGRTEVRKIDRDIAQIEVKRSLRTKD